MKAPLAHLRFLNQKHLPLENPLVTIKNSKIGYARFIQTLRCNRQLLKLRRSRFLKVTTIFTVMDE